MKDEQHYFSTVSITVTKAREASAQPWPHVELDTVVYADVSELCQSPFFRGMLSQACIMHLMRPYMNSGLKRHQFQEFIDQFDDNAAELEPPAQQSPAQEPSK